MVWPQPAPEPAAQTIVLDVQAPAVVRAEPTPRKSDQERVADLERQVRDIAAEQRRLRDEVQALAKRRANGAKREGASR
jgi:hypothetical protein